MKRCAIVGLGMITGPQPGKTTRLLAAEAARRAIEDAGLDRSQIHGAIEMRGSGARGERPFLTDAFPRVLGLPVNFYYWTGRGGCVAGLAVAQATAFLNLGVADYVVLAGANDDFTRSRLTKEQGQIGSVRNMREGYWGTPFGEVRAISFHSFFAARHMKEHGTTSRQLGTIAVQQRQWAQMNPGARFYGRPMTIEDHQNSPYLVYPYHIMDMSLLSDGAVGFVMTTEDRARDCKKPPVWVSGIGFGEVMAELWWNKQNYTTLAVQPARDLAFKQAGITLRDIDVAELYDCFTGEVLMQLEDYGWCGKGEGGPYVEEGHIGPGGDTPVNTSGGLLSAYHLGDMTCMSEAVLQVRGEAGERQVPDCQIALSTGHGGEIVSPGMCSIHSTTILTKD